MRTVVCFGVGCRASWYWPIWFLVSASYGLDLYGRRAHTKLCPLAYYTVRSHAAATGSQYFGAVNLLQSECQAPTPMFRGVKAITDKEIMFVQ